tara:strand:+ start:13395 stop:13565 length:171 start_codon:yes stop_codon:yes gene_type:complete
MSTSSNTRDCDHLEEAVARVKNTEDDFCRLKRKIDEIEIKVFQIHALLRGRVEKAP